MYVPYSVAIKLPFDITGSRNIQKLILHEAGGASMNADTRLTYKIMSFILE